MKPLLLLTLCAATWQTSWAQTGFDESSVDHLRLYGNTYELILGKTNGAILGITDKAAHADLTLGSRNGCLWGTNLRAGCSADSFRYHWDAGQSILTLVYPSATVTLALHPDSFDLKLAISNQSGTTLRSVLLPADLVFETARVQAAYLPYYLPGVRLKRDFFAAHRSVLDIYPSARGFADYLALDIAGGHLSIYSVNPQPVNFGFRDDDKTRPGAFYASHTFQTEIPSGANYETPVVRILVGQDVRRTITAYRTDNHIDAYPDLSAKLGAKFESVTRAPLVKMDFHIIGRTFAEVAARLDQIQSPALLHPVSYWPRSFDQNYPDFLPPNPRYGTLADFNDFVRAAHARGLFVMPYTNPTWWDASSPTAQSATDLSAWSVQGPTESRSTSPMAPTADLCPHCTRLRSVTVSPASWPNSRNQAPVDFVFQDQIGSRSWLRDFNPRDAESAKLFRRLACLHPSVRRPSPHDRGRLGSPRRHRSRLRRQCPVGRQDMGPYAPPLGREQPWEPRLRARELGPLSTGRLAVSR